MIPSPLLVSLAHMAQYWRLFLSVAALFAVAGGPAVAQPKGKLFLDPINIEPQPVAKDASVKYDFDIVYVKAPRPEGKAASRWAEVGDPRTMDPGAALML